MTSFTCVMVQSSGISFSNNFSLCKSQREQVPGSCSLRAHDRWKENVQLETAAVPGAPSWEKLEDGDQPGFSIWDLELQKGHVSLPLLSATLLQYSVAIPPDRPLLTKEEGQKCHGPAVIMGRYYKANNHKVEYQTYSSAVLQRNS